MQRENKWNESDSIQLIRSMVESAKYSIYQDRFLYYLWGYLILGCAAAHYLMAYVWEVPRPHRVWGFMIFGGLVYFFYMKRRKKAAKVNTYLDRVMTGIWSGMGIAIILVLSRAFVIGWEMVYPIFMILYGTASYATGIALKFRALMIGGLMSSVCGFIAFNQPFQYQLLLLMLAVLTSYIIPAHLMRPKSENS